MTQKEYNEKMDAIKHEYSEAKKKLYIQYATSQIKYDLGDIIIGCGTIIKIERFGTHIYRDFPKPSYIGRQLRKDLIPRKDNAIGRINGNEGVKLIKAAKDFV